MPPLELSSHAPFRSPASADPSRSENLIDSPRSYLVFLVISFVPWMAIYWLLAYSFHKGMPDRTVWQTFVSTVGNAFAYWLLAPAIVILASRAAYSKRSRATLTYVVGAAIYCALHPAIRVLIHRAIALFAAVTPIPYSRAAFMNLWTNLSLYVALVYGATAFVRYREARRRAIGQAALRAELAESRLRLLKAQIHPHFLFNTLHDISGLMATDILAARDMMGRLEELLQMVVKEQADEFVPLSQELKFLQCYLDLEKMRLGDRLTIDLKIDGDTLPALVPSMVLQPVVENSIKHGIAKFSKRGWLRITATKDGPVLRLVVEDSGPGISGSAKPGVGLSNTEARLNHHYSRRQSVRYTNLPEEGFRCEITVPFTAAAAEPEVSAPVPELVL